MDNGWVTEAQIAKTVARQLRVPFQDLADTVVRPEAVRALPEGQARRMRAMVLESDALGARVAMADPTDIAAFDEIARIVKKDVQLVAVAESQLLALIDRSYTLGEDIAGLAKELTTEMVAVEDELGELLGLGSAGAEDAPVVRLLQSVFEEALRKRASDIHIEPQEKNLRIRFRIDGVLQIQTEADSQDLQRRGAAPEADERPGYLASGACRRMGASTSSCATANVDVRISTMPTQHGESVVMRLLNQSTGLLQPLGSEPAGAMWPPPVGRAIARPSGMFLGHRARLARGKTTTLYATTERAQQRTSARSSRWKTRSSIGCPA